MLRSRRLLPASVVAAAALLLTAGCSSSPTTSSTPAASGGASSAPSASASASASALACAPSGSASDAVKVTDQGEGKEPEVTFTKGLTASKTQRSVVRAGKGTAIGQGDQVQVAFVIYDATSGKRIDASGYGSAPTVFPVDGSQLLPGLAAAINCTKPGERLASVIPASEAFGTQGSEQLGIVGGDSLVFVADVIGLQPAAATPTPLPSGSPTKATGATKPLPSGFPSITLAASGQPTVKIPATDPPTTLKIASSKVGTGETVRKGDSVTVQYQGVLWRTGQVFDQSWSRGAPATFATTDVVKGFGDALVGAKVGSQVVAIIPPSDGYGDNPPSGSGITKTDTMVFVIDVLATSHAG